MLEDYGETAEARVLACVEACVGISTQSLRADGIACLITTLDQVLAQGSINERGDTFEITIDHMHALADALIVLTASPMEVAHA